MAQFRRIIRGNVIIFIKIKFATTYQDNAGKAFLNQYSTSLIPHIRNMKSSFQTSKSGVPREPLSIHALL
jgi:hypothetical protein